MDFIQKDEIVFKKLHVLLWLFAWSFSSMCDWWRKPLSKSFLQPSSEKKRCFWSGPASWNQFRTLNLRMASVWASVCADKSFSQHSLSALCLTPHPLNHTEIKAWWRGEGTEDLPHPPHVWFVLPFSTSPLFTTSLSVAVSRSDSPFSSSSVLLVLLPTYHFTADHLLL